METNLGRLRLRHAREKLQGTTPGWEEINGQIDRVAGILVHSGLVHALLAMKKGCETVAAGGKEGAQTAVAAALVSWLKDPRAPTGGSFTGMIERVGPALKKIDLPSDSQIRSVTEAIVALIEANDPFAFMAVQDEAHRYCAAMKIVGKAMEPAQVQDEGEVR